MIFTVLTLAVSARAVVVVSPTTLNTNEDGSSVQYQVVLDSPPVGGETVTITPNTTDPTEGTVGAAIVFTDSDWDTPQYITVTPGASGDGNDGVVFYSILNIVTSDVGGGAYDGLLAASVNVLNVNIDGVNTVIVDPMRVFLTEGGAAQTITVRAIGAPTSDITVDFTGTSGEVIPAGVTSIVLTAGNGYSDTFDITAADDLIIDGNQAFSFLPDPLVSADVNFNGLFPFDINGIALDNDVAPVAAAAAPAPTLSEWTLILLLVALGVIGIRATRQREA